ncbi:MDR family MFS transporter [Geosporobacter ferrireducens]|uniref:MDR family MFS transporter n=1 Tax=Geosporobacter ferrireducens TaxID=1424294 RepID=UPI002355A17B|nr:MFS transporter [Geosporobacter ferrireducens]
MSIRRFLGPYQHLSNSIFIIFFARMVNSAGHFVMPFMVMFLRDKIGLNPEQTGYYMMLAAFAYVPGSIAGGKLADILGRKRIFILFQSLAACSFIPCAFLESSMLIPWLLILSSFFSGAAGPANSAMVADLTKSTNRKEAYSLLYMGHNLGFAIGPLAAGFLYRNYLPWIFIGDAFTSFVSIFLVAKFIPETKPDLEKKEIHEELSHNEHAETGSFIAALLKRPVLCIFMLMIALYSFIYVQHHFTLPLQLEEVFGEKDASYYGMIMTTNALTVVFCTTLVTHLTLKLKPIFCVGLGGLFYGIGFGMLFGINHFYLYILSTFIWTLGEILVSTNGMAFVANNTPVSHRGRFNAIFPIIAEAGHAVGPYLTGKYLLSHSLRSVWRLAFFGSLSVACLLFLLQMMESMRSPEINREQEQI